MHAARQPTVSFIVRLSLLIASELSDLTRAARRPVGMALPGPIAAPIARGGGAYLPVVVFASKPPGGSGRADTWLRVHFLFASTKASSTENTELGALA